MQYRKPQAWAWNPRLVRPEWREIASAVAVGFPFWTLDDQFCYDIGPTRSHAPMTVSGAGGAGFSEFGPNIGSSGDNDYLNTGSHQFRHTSFFAQAQEWSTVIRYRSPDTGGGTIWGIAGGSAGGRQIQLYITSGRLTVICRGIATTLDTLTAWDGGDWFTVFLTFKNGVLSAYVPGVNLNTSTTATVGGASEETSQNLTFLARTNGTGFLLSGDVDYFYGFDRALNRAEIEQISRDPFGLLVRDSLFQRFIPDAPAVGGTDIDAALESISLSTFGATVSSDRDIAGALELISLTANPATVSTDRAVSGALESLLLTANPSTVSSDRDIAAVLESIGLTAFASTVSTDRDVSAVLESIGLTVFASSVSTDRDISAGTEAFTLTANPATVSSDRDIAGGLESLSLTANNASIDIGLKAQTEAITLSTFVAAISGDASIQAGLESIQLQALQAGVQLGSEIAAGLESIQLDTSAATVSLDIDLSAGLQSLVLSSLAAQVGLSTDLDAGLESLTLTPQGAIITLDTGVSATLEALTLSAFNATLTLPTTAITAPGIEFTMPESRMHYELPVNRIHFTMPAGRLHFTFEDED